MIRTFKARMETLPPAQQRLWPALRPAQELGFVLYGGTAIALRLGHRASVDFDFFTDRPLDRKAMKAAFPFLARATVLQEQPETLTVLVAGSDDRREHVKVSFFGTVGFGRIGEPELTEDGILQVASLDDLMATKVKVILQRIEAKDYQDIAAMIKANVSLAKGLASARALFGQDFQPSEGLKAMVYFKGGDLHALSHAERQTLIQAASAVRDLPSAHIASHALSMTGA
ncbi:MAG: nucleotidyl transferase AbiEii/AbiGii toxin family protein [Nitrospirae bacterium]|nr:nucleotidyl transferase AbiEii/AbiGii toxin family protein [Nitrospirota bacterium]